MSVIVSFLFLLISQEFQIEFDCLRAFLPGLRNNEVRSGDYIALMPAVNNTIDTSVRTGLLTYTPTEHTKL